MTNRKYSIVFLAAIAALTLSQAHAEEKIVKFDGYDWRVDELSTLEKRNYLGREALFIDRAMAWTDDVNFGDGVIEYDVAAPLQSGFVGVNFRVEDENNFEQFYVRFHQSGRQDATHYLPVFNGLASWQIYVGPNETTAVALPVQTWIHVKIIVKDDKSDIFVGDSKTPLLHAPKLYRDYASGNFAIFASDRPGMKSGAYFSNITVRPLKKSDIIIGAPREEQDMAEGIIQTWRVSEEFPESDFENARTLDSIDLSALDWDILEVERNGVANLAKVSVIAKEADTVLVRTTIHANSPSTRLFQFGYSDRVRLYLNGEQLFFGNAGWRARDFRFLGTIGLNDTVPLRLKAGNNELVAVVSESFGGWGFTGAIIDQSGLTLEPMVSD